MDIQTILVLFILAIAIAFVGATFLKKARSFSPKRGCGDDCGCNSSSKKLHS